MSASGEAVVLCGTSPWSGPWRLGSHFLAEAMSRRCPVVFVDPPHPRGWRVAAAAGSPPVSEVGENLWVVSPQVPRGKDRPGLRVVAQRMWRQQLRAGVSHLVGRPAAVISGQPKHDPFDVCGERTRIFRASDDFVAGAVMTGQDAGRIRRFERRLAERADRVVCVSPPLMDKWRRLGADPVLVPNGCDVDALRSASTTPRPSDAGLPSPVLGYVGLLSEERIDFAALHACLDRGWSVLLVGRRRSDLTDATLDGLLAHPRARWVGERPHAELIPYFGAFEVGLVPYRDTAFNRSSSPLKTLEYLAAGLPVASSDIPAVRALGSASIHLANRADAFVDAVQRALADGRSPAARTADAEPHSWDRRADDYLRLL